MNQLSLPTFQDVQEAHDRIADTVHRTPILSCESINKRFNTSIFFKCENFQKVGAFKFRGACNAVFSLSETAKKRGVGTHSSGNHAAALALAAKMSGIPSEIVMPITAPDIKKKAVAGYGANITYCPPTLEARESTLARIINEKKVIQIHPYDNFEVIAGQGTAAKEFLEDIPNLDVMLIPVGGGGLLAGSALSVKAMHPACRLIAVEPAGADDAFRSFKAGKIIPSIEPNTIADGLLTSLGERNFAIIKDKVDDIFTVSEEEIVEAMRLIWERMKIIVEPSSAVPLALLFSRKAEFKGKKVGIILSGGNVDLGKLPF